MFSVAEKQSGIFVIVFPLNSESLSLKRTVSQNSVFLFASCLRDGENDVQGLPV